MSDKSQYYEELEADERQDFFERKAKGEVGHFELFNNLMIWIDPKKTGPANSQD